MQAIDRRLIKPAAMSLSRVIVLLSPSSCVELSAGGGGSEVTVWGSGPFHIDARLQQIDDILREVDCTNTTSTAPGLASGEDGQPPHSKEGQPPHSEEGQPSYSRCITSAPRERSGLLN